MIINFSLEIRNADATEAQIKKINSVCMAGHAFRLADLEYFCDLNVVLTNVVQEGGGPGNHGRTKEVSITAKGVGKCTN